MRKLATLALIVLILAACKFNSSNKPTLPIMGNRDAVTKTVNGKQVVDTVYQTIPDFKFVNQYGDTITQKNLKGDIYVADFFFTTCPSICPIMHRNMLKVYNEFKSVPDFKIISHTIDPKHDSVAVMKKYADKLGISGSSWWLLQGNKEKTYELGQKNYLVAVKQDDGTPGGYVHQGWFVLVDKQKRIRGYYDGTEEKQVAKMIEDIKILRAEVNTEIAQ
ncbi:MULTISPECIES: SCO family protein [unclassified Mucilaginibacter]|uniref:SCO family protein n=1 Tax=unclassified Mucilaginibacter TaxID=2617802 RepID=UPI002AC8B265|nr:MULTISPECIES: SCO family protein [unclassified Mucilaginibacter]MEB0261386.1 SCO family protein [Mucilaginibacter sp. 10I4]MEB0278855.1 SCO family protein [Mucilaginibacter sp. 10B2]MEB0299779.1 SCO family protein [Mucilaginibacter sp. 5C4]WPX22037.1 SCO family protein [Mucilaginibacter sp. 5C4]